MDSATWQRQVEAALESLGETADEVAEMLEIDECYGRPGQNVCPVFWYLEGLIGEVNSVGDSFAHKAYVAFTRFGWPQTEVPLPTPVRSFIGRFDAGSYPGLLRR